MLVLSHAIRLPGMTLTDTLQSERCHGPVTVESAFFFDGA
jgi:hypothetical protein